MGLETGEGHQVIYIPAFRVCLLANLDVAAHYFQTHAARHHHVCMRVQYAVGLKMVDPDIGRTIVVIIWLIFEPVRLTAGFYGNLKENVSAFHLECLLCINRAGCSPEDSDDHAGCSI